MRLVLEKADRFHSLTPTQLLMIDIVTNHYAYSGSPEDIDYSIFSPFNDESYFHTYCPIDYEDLTNTVRLPATVSE